MRKILQNNNYLIFILVAYLVLIVSCAEDNDLSDREKYLGSWYCKETPAGQAPITFKITISNHGNDDSLDVDNFNLLGSGEKALFIVNGNSIVIPGQDVSGFSVNGSGTYSNNKMNLSYTVDNESFSAECTK